MNDWLDGVSKTNVYRICVILGTIFTCLMGASWLFGESSLLPFVLLLVLVALLASVPKVSRYFAASYSKEVAEAHDQRQRSRIKCPICKGNGQEWGIYQGLCHKCGGRGYIYTYRVGQPLCPPCNGTGLKNGIYQAFCPLCNGVGLLPYEVNDQE